MKISYRKCFNLGNYENEVISIEDDVLDENDFAEVFESIKNKVEDLHLRSLGIDVERKESEKRHGRRKRNGYKIIELRIAASQGRNPQNPSDKTAGCPTEQRLEIGGDISNTVTTVEKDCLVVMPICLNPKVDGKQPSLEHRVYDCGGISTAVTTGFMPKIAVPAVLTPKRNEFGKAIRKKYEAGEIDESRHNMTDLVPRKDGICNTITSVEKNNMLIMPFNADREEMKILSDTADFRIRKLTEREVFRLMDVSEEDIDRIQKAGISRSQQYKMAGNSIVVACLYHIFRKLFVDRGPEDGQLSLF